MEYLEIIFSYRKNKGREEGKGKKETSEFLLSKVKEKLAFVKSYKKYFPIRGRQRL